MPLSVPTFVKNLPPFRTIAKAGIRFLNGVTVRSLSGLPRKTVTPRPADGHGRCLCHATPVRARRSARYASRAAGIVEIANVIAELFVSLSSGCAI